MGPSRDPIRQPSPSGEHGGPVHRGDEREDQRRNGVRDAEDDVLGGVGVRQRSHGQCAATARASARPPRRRSSRRRCRSAKIAADSSRIVAVCRRWLATLASPLPRRGMAMASEAPPSRIGTIFSKPSAGVDSSSTAPIAPPTAATGRIRFSQGRWPLSSGREPDTEPIAVEHQRHRVRHVRGDRR